MIKYIKFFIPLTIKNRIKEKLWRSDLCKLAKLYGTDKWGTHRYAQHYHTHFSPIRKKELNILEIGVGGHDSITKGGASLRMWKAFFPRSQIYAIDIFDKSKLQEDRITIFQGSQNDNDFLNLVANKIQKIDIVIDDGSHFNEHVINAFNALFPLVDKNGFYVIEDMQTAYWAEFGGSENPDDKNISTSIPKSIIDALNWEEFRGNPPAFGKEVVEMHCYHNIVFIKKGVNLEGSTKDKTHKVHSDGP